MSLVCLFLSVVAFKNHFHIHLISHSFEKSSGHFEIIKDSEITYLREAQQANTRTRLQMYGQPQWPIYLLSVLLACGLIVGLPGGSLG